MPSFLSSLRRKSRADIKTEKLGSSSEHAALNGSGQTNGNAGNGTLRQRKSSSTLGSSAQGSSSTPHTSTSEEGTSQTRTLVGGAPPLPTPRPARPSINTANKRYSMNGLSAVSSNGSQMSTSNTSSLLAPRVLSVSDGSWVNQQLLLVFGQIGDASRPLDGTITVNHHHGHFPATQWPVCDSYFKALVYLEPGTNTIRLDFASPKVSSSNTSLPAHFSFIHLNYLPLNSAPPLQLAIILGSDSPGTYDAMPDRIQREGNGLEMAIKKFRMSAYLWQAFTGEQMNRNGFGRRCFRFEDAWEPSTLSYQDWATGQYRNQAKVHIIRSKKTVAEIRDLDLAQQYEHGTRKGELFAIAGEEVKAYFNIQPGQKRYVSCLFLDAHWDPDVKTIRGHAALGGDNEGLGLAIFGSHALHSYPASLEEVAPAFGDCTRTDTAYLANDCDQAGSYWENTNIGIGAHLHETGHLFGCPHQESGVMLRDYVTLNRTFVTRESYSTRTKSPGQRLILQEDEDCKWHRLDILRFRIHPCFAIPIDGPLKEDKSIAIWTVDSAQGGVIATSTAGLAWMEIFLEGDEHCHYWHEWTGEGNSRYPRQAPLVESDLRALLPKEKRDARMKIEIFSAGGGKHTIKDLGECANQKRQSVKLPGGRTGYRGIQLGYSQMQGSEPQEVLLESAYIQTKLLTSIKVYHGFALDGIEFCYEDQTSQLFGKRGGTPGGSEFLLDTRRGELLMGFKVRDGLWIDGLQIWTSLGRTSPWYGNASGGSGHTLMPPRGYTIGGISGSCAQWVDGFSLIITR